MTSKEKLLQLRHDFYNNKELNYDSIAYFTTIEKDLEILEIVKKIYTGQELIDYKHLPKEMCNITEEEWNIFKEWVNNGISEIKPEHRSLDDIQKKNTEKLVLAENSLNRIADALEDIKDIFKWLER